MLRLCQPPVYSFFYLSFRINVTLTTGKVGRKDQGTQLVIHPPKIRGEDSISAPLLRHLTDAADDCPMKTLKGKREYDRKSAGCSLVDQWRGETRHKNTACSIDRSKNGLRETTDQK